MNLIRRNSGTFPAISVWDDFFGKDWLDLSKRSSSNHSLPAVNITESDKMYSIELAAPGMKKDDFKVEVDKDVLTISCEAEDKKEEKESGYTRVEFSFNSFRRSFSLPGEVNKDDIRAAYKDGILDVSIPKKEKKDQQLSKLIEVA